VIGTGINAAFYAVVVVSFKYTHIYHSISLGNSFTHILFGLIIILFEIIFLKKQRIGKKVNIIKERSEKAKNTHLF